MLFGVGLWALSRGLPSMLDRLGIRLALDPQPDQTLEQVISFVGAGIYEEMVFRLILYSGLLWVMRQADMSPLIGIPLAALASAPMFSSAHHLGPFGEDFDAFVFVFRMMAGVYFALLYQLRGFGIAVGAHASYDVLVGVVLEGLA